MPVVLKYYILLLMLQALRPVTYWFSPEGKILRSAFEVYLQSLTLLNSDNQEFETGQCLGQSYLLLNFYHREEYEEVTVAQDRENHGLGIGSVF